MKNYTLCFTIGLTSCVLILLCAACSNDDNLESVIPDPVVRHALADHLNKASNEEITIDELATVTGMFIWGEASDLTGLEHCVNLTWLYVDWFAFISDLSPLSNLTNLRELHLLNQEITDISPLAELTNLTKLDLGRNQISDIGPLSGLTDLSTVVLDGNLITDLQPLATNPGLGAGDIVSVVNNPLSEMSLNIHVPALRTRGVEVRVVD